MQDSKKALTALTAGIAIACPATNCVQAIGNINESENKQEDAEKTIKEALEENVKSKKNKVLEIQEKVKNMTTEMENKTRELKEAKLKNQETSVDFNVVKSEAKTYTATKITQKQAVLDEIKKEMDELNKEKTHFEGEIQKNLKQKNKLEEEQSSLQEKYNKLTSKEGSNFLNQQIETQVKALEELNKQASEVSEKYNKIKEEHDFAIETINKFKAETQQKQDEIQKLQESLGEKDKEMQETQDRINDLQKSYSIATDETLKEKFSKELEQMQLEYNSILEKYNQEKSALQEEQNDLGSLQLEINKLESENQEIFNQYEKALMKQEEIKKQKEDIETQILINQNSLNSIKNEIANTEQEILNKKNLIENLNKSTESLSKLVESTKSAYDSVLAQWNKGSLGFYESIGDEQAKDILNEGIALGTTKIGNNFDATNLDNMKDSISLLVECNRLRVANGLPELNTSGLMMAISQVKLNHSCYQEDQTGDINTGLYGTGENLANGYDLTESDEIHEGKGPYSGWYGWQKENLEEFYKEHPGEKGKDIFEILVDYPDLYDSIKCYLNILSQEYTVTGSAFIPKQNADSLNNFAQEFAWTSQYVIRDGIESITDEGKMYNTATGQMAVSSFAQKFNSYYNGLSQELLSKKAAYERAKQAVNQSNVDGITLSDAKKAYNTACSKLQELKNKKNVLETSQKNQQQAAVDAGLALVNKENQLKELKKIKKLKTDSLSSVREEYENKKVSVSIKENSITNLQNEAVEFSKKIQKAENVLSDAALSNEALGNKKKALEEKYKFQKESRNSVSKSIDNIKSEISLISERYNKKQAEITNIKKELALLQEKEDSINLDIDETNKKLNNLKSQKEEVSVILSQLLATKNLKEEILKNVKQNKESIVECDEIIAELNERESKTSQEIFRLKKTEKLFYQAIEGIPLDNNDKNLLTKEEKDIYTRLVQTVQAKESAQSHLQDTQNRYDCTKADFDALAENFEKAKQNYSQAQYALEEYLNSKNNNLPEIGVEDSTQVKNTNSEDKIGNVDTGIGKRTDKYISIGSVAGLSCLLLRKKKKVK